MSVDKATRDFTRRWLERAENRTDWERLRTTLALADGFEFLALQVADPAAEAVLGDLLREEATEHGWHLAGFDLSHPDSDLPIVRTLLQELRTAVRPCFFYFRGGTRLPGARQLRELFLYLNQKREVVAERAAAPLLLSLHPDDWAVFRDFAPDFWSIHHGVYRFAGARPPSAAETVWPVAGIADRRGFAETAARRLRQLRSPHHATVAADRALSIEVTRSARVLPDRRTERKALMSMLTEPGARVVVLGPAGTGKTTLVRAVVPEVERFFPDGVHLVLSSADEAADEAETVMPMMANAIERIRPGAGWTLDPEALGRVYRYLTQDRKALLVFDEVGTAEMMRQLEPAPSCSMLAVSRSAVPQGWRTLRLSAHEWEYPDLERTPARMRGSLPKGAAARPARPKSFESAELSHRDAAVKDHLSTGLSAWSREREADAAAAFAQAAEIAGDSPLAVPALLLKGQAARYRRDDQQARNDLEAAVARARHHGDPATLAWALSAWSGFHLANAAITEAVEAAQESVRTARRGGDLEIEAEALSTLAAAQEARRDYRQAESAYREALALCEALDGPVHPRVAAVSDNLGRTLLEQSRTAEAEAQFRRAVAINRRAFPAEDPRLAAALGHLGRALERQGKYSEAASCFRESLEIREKIGDVQGKAATQSTTR